jgi:hypothetical protein
MKRRNVRRAVHIIVTVRIPAAHLTAEEYHDRTDPLMEALIALEEANPEHFADAGIAGRAGPTPADRIVDIAALVRIESDHMWARVPALPNCFATGATLEELREALAEAVVMCMEPASV